MTSNFRSNEDGFPRFHDGDVLVVLSPSRQYQLHSRTLRVHSEMFKNMLTEDNAAPLSNKARREGVKTRYRLDLQLPDSESDDGGDLIMRRLDDRGRPNKPNTNPDIDNGMIPPPIYQHYDNFLRAFYYQPLSLNSTNISAALPQVSALSFIAERYQAVDIVTLPINNALISFGQHLWRAISNTPIAWADLGYRIRSELLFREAAIHLIGTWPTRSTMESPPEIRPAIAAMCKRKHDDLDAKKTSIELRIMGHYPPWMQRVSPETANVGPGSVTTRGRGTSVRVANYQKDIFSWMAMNLFRHWLGQHMCGDRNRHAPDGGWEFYDALQRGGDAYVDYHSVESFTAYFPMSAKGRNTFEDSLAKLKDAIKPYVASLLESKLMLDIGKYPCKYLTCAEIERDDMPWENAGSKDGQRETRRMMPEDTELVGESSGTKRKKSRGKAVEEGSSAPVKRKVREDMFAPAFGPGEWSGTTAGFETGHAEAQDGGEELDDEQRTQAGDWPLDDEPGAEQDGTGEEGKEVVQEENGEEADVEDEDEVDDSGDDGDD